MSETVPPTALAALKNDGMDPRPYFDMVARNLLRCHGVDALILARDAVAHMAALGDSEGEELWQEVAKSLWAAAPGPETVH